MKRDSAPKPIVTGLLRQNCYIRDCTPLVDLKQPAESESYYETIEEVVDTSGNSMIHERRVIPYEITPEYVDSFRESSDYHTDPIGAVVSAPKRQNLGDVRDFQSVSDMDDTQAQALFKQLQERFLKAQAEKVQAEKAQAEKAQADVGGEL